MPLWHHKLYTVWCNGQRDTRQQRASFFISPVRFVPNNIHAVPTPLPSVYLITIALYISSHQGYK